MYQIITDSAWDYTAEQAEELGVRVVPFRLCTDGENYLADGIEITAKELYPMMVADKTLFPKTSQPSLEEYYDVFTECAEKGIDVICFTMSSKFTGSRHAAMMARESVLEEHPDAKIEVIDTQLATVLQGLAIEQIAKIQKQGATFRQAVSEAKRIIKTGRIFFTIENLDYLIAGGRIGKLMGNGANVLSVRPLIILREGELFPKGVARGREKSIRTALKHAMDYIRTEGLDLNEYELIVGYGNDKQEGEDLLSRLQDNLARAYPSVKKDISLAQIGCLIGVHTGPYPIGIGLIEKAKA